jgi:hypothetical protein
MSPAKTETKPGSTGKETPPKSSKNTRLPVLWELVNTLGQILVTLVGVAVAGFLFIIGGWLICVV